MSRWLLPILLLLVPPVVEAQDGPRGRPRFQPGQQREEITPEVQQILRKADEATRAMHACSYTMDIWDNQPDAGFVPIRSRVISEKTKRGLPLLKIEAETEGGSDRAFRSTIVHDGESFDQLDRLSRRLVRTPTAFLGRRLSRFRPSLWLPEFTLDRPFDDELEALAARHEGQREVAGVLCDVIFIAYQQNTQARWFFGVEDSLPRRVERLRGRGARIFEVSKLRPITVVTPGTFEYTIPDGYEINDVRRPDSSAHKRLPELLQPGREAPRFELLATDGQKVELRQLRGSVVVLHFWNSWSKPAAEELVRFEAFKQSCADQPVVFLGVNCFEDAGVDVGAAFRKAGQTYPSLIGGDDYARRCRIDGVPAWVIVDNGGRVEDSGKGSIDEKRLREAIRTGQIRQ